MVTDSEKPHIFKIPVAKYCLQDIKFCVEGHCLSFCTGKAENKKELSLSRLKHTT